MAQTISKSIMHEYRQKVRKLLAGGVHYNFNLPWDESPIHFTRGEGSMLWDMDGKQYLDFYARFGASIIGHNNKDYGEKLKATIDRILCVSHSDLDDQVLESIAKHVPSAELIRFGLSGTEIIQNTLRLARAWTGKTHFIRFEGHYHGSADNIMGGKSKAQKTGSYTPYDYQGDFKKTAGRAPGSFEQTYLLPWNDADALEQLLIHKGDEIAAIISEPICITSGGIMPRPGYLKKVRQLCDQYHVVLIFDEVITGFRVGLGGAQSELNVTPDLTIFGKAMAGGGVPVSAVAGKKEIMQLFVDKKVIHAGTFNGYPLGAAAVKATLDILSQDDGAPLDKMKKNMSVIHDIFKHKAADIGLPLVIQGPTNCAAYHVCSKPFESTSDYTYDIMMLDIILNAKLAENGILASTFSRLYPNISLDVDDIEWFETHVGNALKEVKVIHEQMLIEELN